MPMAFMNAGLAFGVVATFAIGFICTYCVHILVSVVLITLVSKMFIWINVQESPCFYRVYTCLYHIIYTSIVFPVIMKLVTCFDINLSSSGPHLSEHFHEFYSRRYNLVTWCIHCSSVDPLLCHLHVLYTAHERPLVSTVFITALQLCNFVLPYQWTIEW
jgi:hypothetical protein